MNSEIADHSFEALKSIRNTYLFLRHGQTDYNLEQKWPGQIDVPLNETGLEQASRVRFPDYPEIVVSSPLARAYETAVLAIASNNLIVSVSIDNRLIEKHGGVIQGMTIQDIPVKFPEIWNAWDQEDKVSIAKNSKYPEGESDLDVAFRLNSLILEIEKSVTHKIILLVTHGGTMRAMRLLADLDLLDIYPGKKIDNCSIEKYWQDKEGIQYE